LPYADSISFLKRSLPITETFGNVTMEALASGLAVLAYDYAAAREYIADGETGVLARFDDAEVFLTKARWMAQSPGRLPAYAPQGARSGREPFPGSRVRRSRSGAARRGRSRSGIAHRDHHHGALRLIDRPIGGT